MSEKSGRGNATSSPISADELERICQDVTAGKTTIAQQADAHGVGYNHLYKRLRGIGYMPRRHRDGRITEAEMMDIYRQRGDGMTFEELGRLHHMSASQARHIVLEVMRLKGLLDPRKKYKHLAITREMAEEWLAEYLEDELTLGELARRHGVSTFKAHGAIKDLPGYPKRHDKERQSNGQRRGQEDI